MNVSSINNDIEDPNNPKLLGQILKGDLPSGKFDSKAIRSAIMTYEKPLDKYNFQMSLWYAKTSDEVTSLIKSRYK